LNPREACTPRGFRVRCFLAQSALEPLRTRTRTSRARVKVRVPSPGSHSTGQNSQADGLDGGRHSERAGSAPLRERRLTFGLSLPRLRASPAVRRLLQAATRHALCRWPFTASGACIACPRPTHGGSVPTERPKLRRERSHCPRSSRSCCTGRVPRSACRTRRAARTAPVHRSRRPSAVERSHRHEGRRGSARATGRGHGARTA
jgi:hypothetical protein